MRKHAGQTLLMVVLVVTVLTMSLGITLTAASSAGLNAALKAADSAKAYGLAQTCLNDALIKMARTQTDLNGSFTSADGSCTIEISGSGPYQVTSSALVGQANRRLQAAVSISDEVLNVTSFQEIIN